VGGGVSNDELAHLFDASGVVLGEKGSDVLQVQGRRVTHWENSNLINYKLRNCGIIFNNHWTQFSSKSTVKQSVEISF